MKRINELPAKIAAFVNSYIFLLPFLLFFTFMISTFLWFYEINFADIYTKLVPFCKVS